jgi:CRP-like cAMP-binding protein
MTHNLASPSKCSLRGVPLFAALTPDARTQIEKRCAWRTYEAGEPIIDYLDQSDDVFFIVEGEARVSLYSVDGKAVTFTDLGSGELFGENAAIDGAPRSASIEALSKCLVASMPAGAFRALIQSEPTLAMFLLKKMVSKIRSLTTRVYEFSTLAVNNRIQAELLRLASLAPLKGTTAEIEPAPTHADIASRTSTHREAVSRELSRLSKIGLIERRGRALVVKDVKRLSAMVQEVMGE